MDRTNRQYSAWFAFGSFLALAISIAARGSSPVPHTPDGLARLTAAFGLTMHTALFPVVAALPAPRWARRAGYAWLVVDLAANAMTFASVADPTTTAIRLAGHVAAAAWIWTASCNSGGSARVVGAALAAWLLGYSVLAPVVPDAAFMPAVPLMLVWLALVARKVGELTPAAETPALTVAAG